MTSQKLCEHVGRIASCKNKEAYEWRGFTVIENHEFYFHPTYIAYAGSLDGYVVHAITRIPTLGVINEKGYHIIHC